MFFSKFRSVIDRRLEIYKSRRLTSSLRSIASVKNVPIPISIHPCDSSTLNNPFIKEQFVQFNLGRSNCRFHIAPEEVLPRTALGIRAESKRGSIARRAYSGLNVFIGSIVHYGESNQLAEMIRRLKGF